MYIQKIKIKNFRNFSDFEMNFKDGLNVIIGSNNSGKTNLLKAIELLTMPDSISIHDFNKNCILNDFKKLYKKQAPEIELSYQIYHEISEDNTDDESIIKLILFLGLDQIEEQKRIQKNSNQYNLVANINMKYLIDPKKMANYINQVAEADTFQKYMDSLELSLQYYGWEVTNGISNVLAEKKEVIDIFKIDYIEADRKTDAVYKETHKAINDFIKDEQNLQSLKEMKQEISRIMKINISPVMAKISAVVEQEKNEIGLEKGNVAIAQDIRLNPTISNSYIIDVKDTKSDYILPLSHNGLGYNNLINIYMLIKLVEIRQGKDFRILCLEEPEAHLHPAMQYKLFSYIKKIDDEDKLKQQIFVTTHSSNITSVAGIDNIYMLDYERENNKNDGVSRSLKEQFLDTHHQKEADIAKSHIMKFLDVTRSDMLFANKVILVEGIAEKLLMPILMKKLNCSYDDEHISIVEIGGKHFDYFIKIFADNPVSKKVLCITDKDYQFTESGKSLKKISEYKNFTPDHVDKLNKKYKNNKNIRIKFQTSYGKTFEDEMLLANYDKGLIACKMLKIAFSKSLSEFLDKHGLSFDKWIDNKDEIDGRSKEKIYNLIELISNAIENYPKDKKVYEKLFFANLFLTYAKNKKGDVALKMLVDDELMNEIIVPNYISEGLKWIKK